MMISGAGSSNDGEKPLARTAIVLSIAALTYYVFQFRLGLAESLGDFNILLGIFLFSCAVPVAFGYACHKLLGISGTKGVLLSLLVPAAAFGAEYVSIHLESAGGGVEKAPLVLAYWVLQLVFFSLGTFVARAYQQSGTRRESGAHQ